MIGLREWVKLVSRVGLPGGVVAWSIAALVARAGIWLAEAIADVQAPGGHISVRQTAFHGLSALQPASPSSLNAAAWARFALARRLGHLPCPCGRAAPAFPAGKWRRPASKQATMDA